MLDDLFEFLQGAVTPYHAAAIAAAWLDAAGYTRLEEADYWNLEAGKGYYITRNGSSVIAWRHVVFLSYQCLHPARHTY